MTSPWDPPRHLPASYQQTWGLIVQLYYKALDHGYPATKHVRRQVVQVLRDITNGIIDMRDVEDLIYDLRSLSEAA